MNERMSERVERQCAAERELRTKKRRIEVEKFRELWAHAGGSKMPFTVETILINCNLCPIRPIIE